MNWLLYIGGGVIFLAFLLGGFWDIAGHVKLKEFKLAIFKFICVLCVWIWICWKISLWG